MNIKRFSFFLIAVLTTSTIVLPVSAQEEKPEIISFAAYNEQSGNTYPVGRGVPAEHFVAGEVYTLRWTTKNASYCTASGDWSGTKDATGSEEVRPTRPGFINYTLTCERQGVQSYGIPVIYYSTPVAFSPFVLANAGIAVQPAYHTGVFDFISVQVENTGPANPRIRAQLNGTPGFVGVTYHEQAVSPTETANAWSGILGSGDVYGNAVSVPVYLTLKRGSSYIYALTAQASATKDIAVTSGVLSIDLNGKINLGSPMTQSITNVLVESITTTSATFRWNTSQPSGDNLYIGTSVLNMVVHPGLSASRTDHTVTLNYLNPNTTYYYYIAANNPSGGTVTTEPAIFTTKVEPPPPPVPSSSESPYSPPSPTYSPSSYVTSPDPQLMNRLKGRILLQVGERGEAWYVRPDTGTRVFMGRPADAFALMRGLGLGITNAELRKIPVGIQTSMMSGSDSDRDMVPDSVEEILSTNPYVADSDGDGYNDYEELMNNFDPTGQGFLPIDEKLAGRLKGRILLQVQRRGEAWYLNPVDGKRYFLGRPSDAFDLMRVLGLGITNTDLAKIPIQY